MIITAILVLTIVSIVICHQLAKSKGRIPVFWGMLAAFVGPLAIPFIWMTKVK